MHDIVSNLSKTVTSVGGTIGNVVSNMWQYMKHFFTETKIGARILDAILDTVDRIRTAYLNYAEAHPVKAIALLAVAVVATALLLPVVVSHVTVRGGITLAKGGLKAVAAIPKLVLGFVRDLFGGDKRARRMLAARNTA